MSPEGARIAYFDCFCGISGDMILGALVDAGLDPALLRTELDKLKLSNVSVTFETAERRGIRATRAVVHVSDESITPALEHHLHIHDSADLAPTHSLSLSDAPHQTMRQYRDIVEILDNSHLDEEVRTRSLQIFERLADAEAEVHGVDRDEVHFHEVGALDAIVDVVGAVAGLRLLEIDQVYASPLHCGTGVVNCAHGMIPVPVPAVVALCRDVPVVQTDIAAELVTPTGAAIITTLAAGFGPLSEFVQGGVGYGAGTRDLDARPNVLRVRLGTSRGTRRHASDEAVLIEANIDDMNPEVYGYLFDRLLEEGAKDVYVTPVHMKKGRPGNVLTVLVDEGQMEDIADLILRETTTIGLRFNRVERRVLERSSQTVSTSLGDLRVKVCSHLDGSQRLAPEYEDCARLARANNIPLLSVYEAAMNALKEE
jgi:hypothetical protein